VLLHPRAIKGCATGFDFLATFDVSFSPALSGPLGLEFCFRKFSNFGMISAHLYEEFRCPFSSY
jgi:hypothetical protein